VIRNVDRISIETLAQSMSRSTYELRKYGDASFEKLKGDTLVARGAARILMRTGSFFLYTLNTWSPVLGFPKNAFGSAAITDISRFGAEYAFPPILPIAHVPLVVGVGPVAEKCVPDSGGCRPVKWLRLCMVFDHRVIDGVYAGHMCHYLKEIFSKPEIYLLADAECDPVRRNLENSDSL
jgi:pyruvate dehydrogenase E2 component (dihydrolipoamide acetyltransferase)